MKVKDHTALGRYIIENSEKQFGKKRYQKAFLFGCFSPDRNFFSYLKGSTKHEKLRGHNYDNAYQFIDELTKKLNRKKKLGIRQYYQMGKLSHYVADAFTYPHNKEFGENIAKHVQYELDFHKTFGDKLHPHYIELKTPQGGKKAAVSGKTTVPRKTRTTHSSDALLYYMRRRHDDFLREKKNQHSRNFDTDISYITTVPMNMIHSIMHHDDAV